jgi:ATP-binding cassette subfamily C exporter for protease/lipase
MSSLSQAANPGTAQAAGGEPAQKQPRSPEQNASRRAADRGARETVTTAGRELAQAFWTFRKEFLWVGFYSFIANLLMLTPTLYMMQIFDRIFLSRSEWSLISLTAIATVFLAAMAFAEWVRGRLLVRAGVRFDLFLNTRVFGASFEANLNQARHKPFQAFQDLLQIRQFITGNGIFAFFDLPWTVLYLLILFVMHPVLGWSALGFVVLHGLLAVAGQYLTSARHERATATAQQTNAHLAMRLRNAETVQAMGMLGDMRRQWLGLYRQQVADQQAAQAGALNLQAVLKFVQYTQQSVVLAIGAWLVVKGEITAGAMIASNALMSNALRPITTLVSTWRPFVDARKAWHRLGGLLEEHPERPPGLKPEDVKGQVELEALVATTAGREAPILKGLNARFEAGEVVAIVGPSGAGKSTLARCIVGIWPQTEGRVLLDGHPVQHWVRESLGPRIGYLPQDIELFDGTIAENIARFGKVDPERVVKAARQTGIHEMILRLPQGYDTPIGVAGNHLSGGQRQRVGLARAIYADPALVVLDEPNANLDEIGIEALIATIRALKETGCTVFLIVHQVNLLAVADRVLVLADGRITHLGPLAQTRTATT